MHPRVVVVCLAAAVTACVAACGPRSQEGQPCTGPDDPDTLCEERVQLRCNSQIYVRQSDCSSECSEGVAEVAHQGDITSSQTWACEAGIHVVTGLINVAAGTTLTVAPGALVKINEASRIDVDRAARFVVDAPDLQKVLVTSANGEAGGFGASSSGGINVFASEGEPSILRGLIVERGIHGIGVFGLSSTTATPVIENSTFRDNQNFGIKLGCDEIDFVPPDFSATCGDVAEGQPCDNSFFGNGDDVSACNAE